MTITMSISTIAISGISGPLAIISMVSIATISIAMSIAISGLSFSGSFAIVSMMTICTIAIADMSIAISRLSSSSWLGGSSWLSNSRPLAIISVVTISSIAISVSISVTVAIPRLGNSHAQKGQGNSNQKIHVVSCSFSTTLPMYSA